MNIKRKNTRKDAEKVIIHNRLRKFSESNQILIIKRLPLYNEEDTFQNLRETFPKKHIYSGFFGVMTYFSYFCFKFFQ